MNKKHKTVIKTKGNQIKGDKVSSVGSIDQFLLDLLLEVEFIVFFRSEW